MPYDLVITGGRIVDGTGAPAYDGDVAITDGRIAALGDVSGSGEIDGATRTINATGHVVAARVHRRPHPLRRPAALGPDRQPVHGPRDHHGPASATAATPWHRCDPRTRTT